MGASQSNPKGGHFAPATIERSSLQVPNKSTSKSSNKNSFSKHQLNKLLRKGTQAGTNGDAINQQVRSQKTTANNDLCDGELNNDDDGRKYFVPSSTKQSDRSGELMRADMKQSLNGYGENLQQQQQKHYVAMQHQASMQAAIRPTTTTTATHQLEQTSGNNFNTLQQHQQQLMNMQSRFNCSSTSTSAGAHRAQTLERRLHEKPPFKGSGSMGTSSSSSASSFHEGAGQRVHQRAQTQFQPTSNDNANFNSVLQCDEGANVSRRLVANSSVAMQQPMLHSRPHHQRANSSGGSLSWSKQAQQPQLQQQQLDSLEFQFQNFVPLQQYQQQQQQQRSAIASAACPSQQPADEIEQFYSRNLHLLTDQHQAPQLYNPQDDFYHNAALIYDDLHNPISPVFPSSAPTQRRYKWPKQQYQYYNQDQQQRAVNQQKQQHINQSTISRPSSGLTAFYQQPISADYATTTTTTNNYAPATNDSLIYYGPQASTTNNNHVGQQNLMADCVSPFGFGVDPMAPTYASSNTHQLSLKSSKKAATISSKSPGRQRNPLSAIFNFGNTSQLTASHKQNHSNTIHLAGSKSHQNLQQAEAGRLSGGSLKRVKSSPLTAQQTSYEAMRTIDMYLIRQIARTCMDFEMEQKIDLEIRLRELASQSLLEARNEIDVLEVEKSLLTSDQRMNCYAAQLEEQRKKLSNPSLSTDSGRASCSKASNWGGRRDGSLGRTRKQVQANTSIDQKQTQVRSDVIGASPNSASEHEHEHSLSASSPSCGSLSKSSQSSPSKLSPVSGESANSVSGASETGRSKGQNCTTGQAPSSTGSSTTLTRRRNGLSNKSSSSSHKSTAASKLAKQRERLKQNITSQSNINWNMVTDNKATLSLSELRIPLMWRDVDHFKGRGDYRRYAVFCLLKIGSQIYDTQLISDVDRQHTDLTFEDLIVFNNIEHDFELTLEVYSCVYLEQFSLSSTPRKLKEKLSNSVSRAMGRRLATQTASTNFIKELEAYDKSYRFAMIASARLGLADAAESVKTYDLQLMSPEAHGRHSTSNQFAGARATAHLQIANQYSSQANSFGVQAGRNHSGIVTAGNQKDLHKNTLPLFGHFCCRLHVRPDVFDKCIKSGYLRVGIINLPVSLDSKALSSERVGAVDGDKKHKQERVRGRSDWSVNDDSGKSSSSNDEMSPANERTGAADEANSMLRTALAASGKLATISMSTATVHWALLRNFTLHLWQIDEHKVQMALRRGHAPQVDISCKQPFCIGIDKFTRLLRVSNSSLTLETDKGCFVIGVHNINTNSENHCQDEIGQWLRPIEQMIYDSHIWSSVLQHYPPSRQRNRHSKH